MATFSHLASMAVPALPGATKTFYAWVLRDFPGQGVLTAAAADDQNFHVKTSIQVTRGGRGTLWSGVPANAAVNSPSYSRARPLPQDPRGP